MSSPSCSTMAATMALGDARKAHGRGARLEVCGLGVQVRHVHKAAAHAGVAVVKGVEELVEDLVAAVGAGAVGHVCGHALLLAGVHHGLNGQGGKVGVRAILLELGGQGLEALVVGDAEVCVVDAHELRGDLRAAASLAHTQDHVGLLGVDGGLHGGGALLVHHGDLNGGDVCARDLRGQAADGLVGRVDGLAAKGHEAGDQDLHGYAPLIRTGRHRTRRRRPATLLRPFYPRTRAADPARPVWREVRGGRPTGRTGS